MKPKTPLPWFVGPDPEGDVVRDANAQWVGYFDDPLDAAYAVHAANALPEVAAALRGLIEETEGLPSGLHLDDARDAARAALAKAEGAPEDDGA